MSKTVKIGLQFNCTEEYGIQLLRSLLSRIDAGKNKMAIIDLSGRDWLFSAISCHQAENREEIYHTAPRIVRDKCKFCANCVDVCKQKAISLPKGSDKVIIEPELCTDCGKCYKACSKKGAMMKSEYLVGLIEWTDRNENLSVFRMAFRKKWILKKKGFPLLEKLLKKFDYSIFNIDVNYCGNSLLKQMNYIIEITDNSNADSYISEIYNLIHSPAN